MSADDVTAVPWWHVSFLTASGVVGGCMARGFTQAGAINEARGGAGWPVDAKTVHAFQLSPVTLHTALIETRAWYAEQLAATDDD